MKILDNPKSMRRSPWKLAIVFHQRLWLLGMLIGSTMSVIKKVDNLNGMRRSPWKLATMLHQWLWLLGVLPGSTMSIVEEVDNVNWMTIGVKNQPWCLFNDYEC